MQRITSFEVDHNKLTPGLYISRVDGDITTYDLRTKKPNSGDYMDSAAMHTIEHLFATYVRNSPLQSHIIYAGPMGCRTGFYLLVRDLEPRKAVGLIKESFALIKNFDDTIPGSTKIECGHYEEHDLAAARRIAAEYTEVLNGCSEKTLVY